VARIKEVPEAERQERLQSGQLRFYKKVAFARQYLVWAGYLDDSKREVWSLTAKGLAAPEISDDEAARIAKEQNARLSISKHENAEVEGEEEKDEGDEELVTEGYQQKLMSILLKLPSAGFERLAQRLLRESGFEQVEVTGKSGDGGIDGIGIVKVNNLVTFKVLFQCKRYSGAVSASQVRDFRGAMVGRADKGIMLTTGTFTKDAQREAVRDGVPPIELLDGDQLVLLLEKLELGLIPRKTYEVDVGFFDQFGASVPAEQTQPQPPP
jgi:restriction system protein